MASLLSKFNRVAFKQSTESVPGSFEIIKFKKSLLNALVESRKNGSAIGIYSSALGEGMFVTGVEDIYDDNRDYIVVLKPYDLSGTILQRNTLSLSEIKAACAFDMPYRNPVLI